VVTVVFEQKVAISDEWACKIWTDRSDWCSKCDRENNKLVFDDQAKTATCIQCGYVQNYEDKDWKFLQAKRYVIYQYTPGKYFFNNLSVEEVFSKYLRELNHVDWSSWLIHDYVLARMRGDTVVQDKLRDVSKLIVEKMAYDSKPWQTLFEKMNAQDKDIFYQVPQILYEYAEKHLYAATTKENHYNLMRSYLVNLTNMYRYNRWKGDRVACWITSETIKLCDVRKDSIDFYTELFNCDPMLDNFQDDMLAGKKREINIKDSYIQWELRLADTYLEQSCALVAVQAAYEALGVKLGIHDIWPPKKALPFDVNTVKKVTQLFDDSELFRFYDLATDLDAIDPSKACYYANLFISKVKKMLPNVTSIEQEKTKQAAYIT